MGFFQELKRRNVYKVAAAYAVVAWLLVQAASILFPTFDAPSWVMKVFVALVAAGFPIALVLAWAFEMTPEGIARTGEAAPAPKRRGGRLWIYVVLIGAALSLGLFFLGRYTAGSAGSSWANAGKSIAVLPLVNQSGDSAQEYFSDGLTEELINGLGQIDGLRVIGRNSSFHYKGKSDDSRAIGQALGVANLLEGSVRKAGDRVRISVALVEAANGSQRWSQTYDRELKDIFAVQEEIARAVADEMRVKLLGDEVVTASRPSNGSLEAYNAYLLGEQYSRAGSPESLVQAIEYLDEAIRLDPRYADAYARKSLAWAQIGNFRGTKGREAFAEAKRAAEQAIALRPNLDRARGALAYVLSLGDWDLAGAEAQLLRPDRNSPVAPNMLSNLRAAQRRYEEALQLQKEAVRRDPAFGIFRRNLASRLISLGRLEEAEAELRKALELQPQAAGVHFDTVVVAVLRGQVDVAWREAQLEAPGIFRDTAIALAQAARGNRAEADAALKVLIDARGEEAPFRIATVYAFRKETDKMFEWLERAYILHDPRLITLLADPWLQPYHSEPRFGALCQKMRLPVPK